MNDYIEFPEAGDPAEITDDATLRHRLLTLVALSTDYCVAMENAREAEKREFVIEILNYLPRIYWEFSDLEAPSGIDRDEYLTDYMTEDYYESVRLSVANLLGEDDTFLETFEEDMKYSDTPIAASVSESLADIFQPLYNFVTHVRESEGESLVAAFRQCKDDFVSYWSQTLCNVLRALNNIRYGENNN